MNRLLLAILILSGCASQGVDRADQHHIIQEFYASVQSVKKIKLTSDVPTATIIGASAGVLEQLDGNSEEMIAGGIAGALIGGLITAIFEGSNDAYQYQLYNDDMGQFTLIQKQQLAKNTACVSVRVAAETSISAVPTAHCTK